MERAEIEFTDARYTKRFEVFPLKHRFFDIVRLLPAQLRRATGEIQIPTASRKRRLRLGGDRLADLVAHDLYADPVVPEVRRGGNAARGRSIAGFVVCRRYWKNNLKTVQKLAEENGATCVGRPTSRTSAVRCDHCSR